MKKEELIRHQVGEIEMTKHSIETVLCWIERKCSVLRERLDPNNPLDEEGINSLGELQGLALDLDRGCALLRSQKETLRLLEKLNVS